MIRREAVIDAAAVRAYARLTGDDNPLHLDPDFAAGTEFGQPVAYGTIALNHALAFLAEGDARIDSFEARLMAPVFVPSVVAVIVEPDANDPDQRRFRVETRDGRCVLTGTARLR